MRRLISGVLLGLLAAGVSWILWGGAERRAGVEPGAGSARREGPGGARDASGVEGKEAGESFEAGKTEPPRGAASGKGPQTQRLEDQLLAPRLELSQGELEWEARVRSIRESPGMGARARSAELLRLLGGGLPEEALESVAEEALAGLADADYGLATGLLCSPLTHGRVQSVLFADLVERPAEVALPGLLAVARVSGHPFARAAVEDLEFFLGVNHGADWDRWGSAVRGALKGAGKGPLLEILQR
jgi:hypothetical protein